MRLAEAEISPAEPIGLGEGVAECRLHLLWVGCSFLKRGFDSSGITGTGKKQPAAASSLKLTKPGGARPVPHGGAFARGTFAVPLSPLVFLGIARAATEKRAPIVYRNLIMARRGHVKFMGRLRYCNDQISPRLTRLNLGFVVRR